MSITDKSRKVAHVGALEGPSGRFWSMRIEPEGMVVLLETLVHIFFVIKNLGPHTVRYAQHGERIDIPPGAVRATFARGVIWVENTGENPVQIEFEFLPFCN